MWLGGADRVVLRHTRLLGHGVGGGSLGFWEQGVDVDIQSCYVGWYLAGAGDSV